ncbi:exo-beta-N-acetylmuramidase NamZ domain-containing protein [Flexivirga alba]|uniref:Exo-beta-N-acetylmuramidase NamZ domain-containing protein n=1 Tax=Flexivirga alba TaxID=702742 RepID=A0ABW2AIJ5_9MICO
MNNTSDDNRRLGRRGFLGAAALSGAGALTIGGTQQASAATARPGRHRFQCGADVAAADGWKVFAGQRIGVITNPTGVVRDGLRSIVDVMVESGKVEIGGVFGPEHGFRGTAQAGQSEETYVDERTGVTVYDAYGATIDKFASYYGTAGVDTIVFDIQDVGARFYTYIWTMYNAMAAAAKLGKRFVVLDRPNPVGGQAKGPVLKDGFTSGVGLDKIAQQHGMTAGELARFFNGEFMTTVAGKKVADLEVVQVQGWSPDELYADTGAPWILPSPNMPTPDTALLYPGLCMFEATNLSEGRGTTRPFELIGAPYVDYKWAQQLAGEQLPGVEFREAYFNPTFSKNAGKVCGGVQVHIIDAGRVDAIRTATTMMTALRDLYDGFDWRGDAGRWINLLTGSDRFLKMFTAGDSAAQIVAAWQPELQAFDRTRRQYLLYRR